MDQRESMAAYYFMQRGMTGSASDSGQQFGIHGSNAMNPFANPNNAPFQSSIGGSTESTMPVEPPSVFSPHVVNVGALSAAAPPSEPPKRKRGRPRKYGADGSVSLALSPSSITPPVTIVSNQHRGRGRPPGSGKKRQLASLGGLLSGSAGMGFTPHIITVSVGEDIATKIMSFSQQGPRAVCILSASGSVSSVTLLQPSTSGGTVKYEGCFEILCLSGSYLLTDTGGSHNRSGGLSVSLSCPNGQVVGGGVGGMLIAAGPVQVIVGSFLSGGSNMKNKKQDGSLEARPVDHQIVDNSPIPDAPSQNPAPTSPMGMWPGSRPVDFHNAHVDIDLMSG